MVAFAIHGETDQRFLNSNDIRGTARGHPEGARAFSCGTGRVGPIRRRFSSLNYSRGKFPDYWYQLETSAASRRERSPSTS
jgi:hypothetical protein